MVNEIKYRKELEHARNEHNAVEAQITELMRAKVVDQFKVQSLKKQKLRMKEMIINLEAMLLGDIVA
jgi:hypothetical protein